MDQLQLDIARLQDLKQQIDSVKPLKEEYDELREQVRFGLEAQNLKSIKNDKVSVSISERQSVLITSETDVENWLTENGFALDEYVRLDTSRVSPLVLSKLKEDGELVPGTDIVSTPFVSIRNNK